MDVLNPGKMISIEGVEGVGKSTLIPIVAQEVEAEGHSVIMTREPGGTEIGEREGICCCMSTIPISLPSLNFR